MRTTTETAVRPHGTGAKIAHWSFIVVYVYALFKQLDEVEELEDFALLQYEIAFASIFLILLVARFIFMRKAGPTALPSDTPQRMLLLARTVHLGMYVSLSMIAITGLIIGGLYWNGIKSGDAMDLVLLLHEIAVNGSYLLILGHIAGAVYHRRKGDGIWGSMVPIWKESRGREH